MDDVCSTHMHNNLACKDKRGTIVGELKKIYDYKVGIRHDAKLLEYEHARYSYRQHFGKIMYEIMEEFFGSRPIFQLTHMRGLMDEKDHIFNHISFTQK